MAGRKKHTSVGRKNGKTVIPKSATSAQQKDKNGPEAKPSNHQKPQPSSKLAKDRNGRYVETKTWEISYEDMDKGIDRETALRYVYGPGFDGKAFNANVKNIWNGTEFKSGHHSSDGNAKSRHKFTKGSPPQ
jgi:hypothetical protein